LIALSTLAVIPSKTTSFKVISALVGKFAVTSSWCVLYLHVLEVYPTVIRHIGLGSSSVGRFDSIAAPFMKNLVRIQFFSYINFFIRFKFYLNFFSKVMKFNNFFKN
jgi:hypothetical protein